MNKLIAQLIKEKRSQLGFTQHELSQYLGLSSSQYISNIERGLCGASVDVLVKLSELLKIDQRKLLNVLVDEYRETLKIKLRRAKSR